MDKKKPYNYNTFEDFWPDFVAATSSAIQRKKHQPLRTIITKQSGFIPNPSQVEKTVEHLRDVPSVELLKFHVIVAARSKPNPSRMALGLADYFSAELKTRSGMPPNDSPTWTDVRHWLNERVAGITPTEDQPSVIRAIYCDLLLLKGYEFYPSALLLLCDLWSRGKSKRRIEPGSIGDLLSEVLANSKPSRKLVKAISKSADAFRAEIETKEDRRRAATNRVDSLTAEIQTLENQVMTLRSEKDEAVALAITLRSELENARKHLGEATGRIAGLEEHWSVVSKQQLNGLISKLRSEIEHETKEILLSLSGSSPNTQILVQRVQRIENVIQKAASNK